MKTKLVTPSPRVVASRDKIIDMLRRDFADVPAHELLAMVSYTVGQLVALQDQRRFTPEMAMKIVADNLEAGNQSVIENLREIDERNPQ